MAQTVTVSIRELKRQMVEAFEGKTVNVMLCNVGATGYDEESTVANWQSAEVSGNGYTRFSDTLGTSSYNGTTGRHELPAVVAEFGSTGTINYDRVIIYFTGETYIHSMIVENPNVIIASGQTQSYEILFTQND
jgi:hypothetical protein